MKRTLLLTALAATCLLSYGQVSTYVLQPASISGALDFTIADDWGLTPDMNEPANLVQAYAAIVDDGTEADSLGCNALVNGTDLAGKIAIVYRGDCEFGLKALNAQNGGAVGVVIVNNIAGAPVGMAAGVSGASVTIPVVMISQDAGALIHDEVVAGNVEMFIGTVQNMFPNNVSLRKSGTLIPAEAARPSLLSLDATEYQLQLGAWLYNYGSLGQTGATLQATVVQDGTTLYDETSDPGDIASGDSLFFSLPVFTQPGYNGRYEIAYTAHITATDEFPDDNEYATTLSVDTMLSYAPLDEDGLPIQTLFVRPADASQVFQICATFMDPNASRMRMDGAYAAATVNAPDHVTGQQLDARLFEWNDVFTGLSDATLNDISEVMNGVFQYTDSAQARQAVFIPFAEPMELVDNQYYIVCVSTSSELTFLGHSAAVHYDQNDLTLDRVTTLLNIDGAWSGGWNTGEVPALGVKMVDVTTGIQESKFVELTPFPNPTSAQLSIPMQGQTGNALLQVFDAKGALVIDEQVQVGPNNILNMNLGALDRGVYMFHMNFDNGNRSSFRVVVSQ